MAQKKAKTSNTSVDASDSLLAISAALEREARALDGASIQRVRLPLDVARHNALVGATAVLGQREHITKELKKPNFKEVERLVSLIDATQSASRAVKTTDKQRAVQEGDLERLYPLRSILLSGAEALAASDLMPAKAVADIRAGKGSLDAATDLLALANLFAKHKKKIDGKTAVTAEQLQEAKALGTRLSNALKPTRAKSKKERDEDEDDAADLRDRLYTMALNAYEVTWKMGALVWGTKVSEHVPALGAHDGKS